MLPYARAKFNWFPNEHSQESPHFMYFGCDPYLPHLAAFLHPKLRCLGLDKVMTHLDKLQQAYMLAALNTKEACSKQNKDKYHDVPQYEIGDLVMIKNFNKKSNWDANYIPNFRIVIIINLSQLEVSDPSGRLWKVNISDVHKILPTDFIISSIQDEQVFGRKGKYKRPTYPERSYRCISRGKFPQMLELDISNYLYCPLSLYIFLVYMFMTIMSHMLPHLP